MTSPYCASALLESSFALSSAPRLVVPAELVFSAANFCIAAAVSALSSALIDRLMPRFPLDLQSLPAVGAQPVQARRPQPGLQHRRAEPLAGPGLERRPG